MQRSENLKRRSFGALWLVSPYAAALFSLVIALLAFGFPPHLYEALVDEPDYVYLSPDVLIYVLFSFVLFIAAGYFSFLIDLSSLFLGKRRFKFQTLNHVSHAMVAATLVWVGLFLVLNLITLLLTIRYVGLDMLIRALIGDVASSALRKEVASFYDQANLTWTTQFGKLLAAWGLWVFWALDRKRKGRLFLRLFGLLLVLFLSVLLANLLLWQGRGTLLSFIFSLVLVAILRLYMLGQLNYRSVAMFILGFMFLVAAFFGWFQYTRKHIYTETSSAYIISDAVGYTLGSYNRLAAIMHGYLYLPGAYTGYYATQWLWEFPALSKILDLKSYARSLFGDLPVSEFADVYPYLVNTELNPTLSAVSIFGYTFIDFGWMGFLFFLPYGLLVGRLWKSFLSATIYGVMLYPVVLWSVLEWRGYIEITRPYLIASFLIPFFVHFTALVFRGVHGPRSRRGCEVDGYKVV